MRTKKTTVSLCRSSVDAGYRLFDYIIGAASLLDKLGHERAADNLRSLAYDEIDVISGVNERLQEIEIAFIDKTGISDNVEYKNNVHRIGVACINNAD